MFASTIFNVTRFFPKDKINPVDFSVVVVGASPAEGVEEGPMVRDLYLVAEGVVVVVASIVEVVVEELLGLFVAVVVDGVVEMVVLVLLRGVVEGGSGVVVEGAILRTISYFYVY